MFTFLVNSLSLVSCVLVGRVKKIAQYILVQYSCIGYTPILLVFGRRGKISAMSSLLSSSLDPLRSPPPTAAVKDLCEGAVAFIKVRW